MAEAERAMDGTLLASLERPVPAPVEAATLLTEKHPSSQSLDVAQDDANKQTRLTKQKPRAIQYIRLSLWVTNCLPVTRRLVFFQAVRKGRYSSKTTMNTLR